MQQVVQRQEKPIRSQTDAHGQTPLRLPGMRKLVPRETYADDPSASAQWRTPFQMRALREVIPGYQAADTS